MKIASDSALLSQFAYSDAAHRALARTPALFIDGDWVASTHGRTIAVIDPSSGKQVSELVDASDADVDRAVAAARKAFDDGRWTDLPSAVRERKIQKLADLIEENCEELAELEAIDNGKPKSIAAANDIQLSVGILREMAGWATKLGGELIEPSMPPRGTMHSYVRREPVGVAAQIVPWNFPLFMAAARSLRPWLPAVPSC